MIESADWRVFRWCGGKRLLTGGLRLGPILCSLAVLGTACVAVVGPPHPAPAGQVDTWPVAVKQAANPRRYLPAALDTAPIRPAACGLVTSRWTRIAVGVTSLP